MHTVYALFSPTYIKLYFLNTNILYDLLFYNKYEFMHTVYALSSYTDKEQKSETIVCS